MKNQKSSEPELVLKTALVKYYEFIPIIVYVVFLVGLIWDGINTTQIIAMTIIGLVLIFIGVKRLLDNKPKVIIDSNGIKLTDENIVLKWSEISDIQIGEKTVKQFNSFKSGYDTTVNLKNLTIQTNQNKRVDKIIEKYRFSNKELGNILQYYMDMNKTKKIKTNR